MLAAVSLSAFTFRVRWVSLVLICVCVFSLFIMLHGCCCFAMMMLHSVWEFSHNFYSSIIIVCFRLCSTPISLFNRSEQIWNENVYATAHFRYIPTDSNPFLLDVLLYPFHFRVCAFSFSRCFIFGWVIWHFFRCPSISRAVSRRKKWKKQTKNKTCMAILCVG